MDLVVQVILERELASIRLHLNAVGSHLELLILGIGCWLFAGFIVVMILL